MRERIILTFVCAFGSLCVAAVVHETYNPYDAFWITFGIMETFALCAFNYLENGIFWFWGMTKPTREGKAFEKSHKDKYF